jgi:hypothetical protein
MLQAHKLFESWPGEGVEVLGLVSTWYDTKVKSVVLMESYFRREVVVEEDKRPGSSLPPPEWAKPISGKAKGNVTGIREVFVQSGSPIDDYFLPQ